MSRLKHSDIPPDKPMPEYATFPKGMWHMFGAVILMVFCLGIVVVLISDMFEPWLGERALMYVELATLVVLSFALSTATFLLSRGWSACHHFLIWHNRAYLLILLMGTVAAFVSGSNSMATVGFIGFGLSLIANRLYQSDAYRACVEYYRIIWAHHRYNQKPQKRAQKPLE